MFTLFRYLRDKHKHKKDLRTQEITVYAVFAEKPILDKNGSIKNKNIVPCSFAANYEQAKKILERLLYFKHFDHYRSWIYYSKHLEHMKPGFGSDCWNEYRDCVLAQAPEDDFYILKLNYTNYDFASLLRIFSSCNPLYLPHERLEEYVHYAKNNVDENGSIQLSEEILHTSEEDDALKEAIKKAYTEAFDKYTTTEENDGDSVEVEK